MKTTSYTDLETIAPKVSTLRPSKGRSFYLRNACTSSPILHTKWLKFTVLDSPFRSCINPSVAAMIIPNKREADWVVTTKQGYQQLILENPEFSRLILIGNETNLEKPIEFFDLPDVNADLESLKKSLTLDVVRLCPIDCYVDGFPQLTFLVYDKDRDAFCRLVHQGDCAGKIVGDMLIDIVGVKNGYGNSDQFIRRLTFKQSPNVFQTLMRVIPSKPIDASILHADSEKPEFLPETGILIQEHLTPMLTGLCMISVYLNERVRGGNKLRALCLGVGGGSLASFLNTQLDFEVIGVDWDLEVLLVAKKFFGLENGKSLRLIVGNRIGLMEEIAHTLIDRHYPVSPNYIELVKFDKTRKVRSISQRFEVVFVDLLCGGGSAPVTAPPPQFIRSSVLEASRDVLNDRGLLVVNVALAEDPDSYHSLVQELRHVFPEIYKISVRQSTSVIIIASASPIEIDHFEQQNLFLKKFESLGLEDYRNEIKRI